MPVDLPRIGGFEDQRVVVTQNVGTCTSQNARAASARKRIWQGMCCFTSLDAIVDGQPTRGCRHDSVNRRYIVQLHVHLILAIASYRKFNASAVAVAP